MANEIDYLQNIDNSHEQVTLNSVFVAMNSSYKELNIPITKIEIKDFYGK